MTGYILKETPNPESCARKWIRLTDSNWQTAVQWYRSCSELASGLEAGQQRDGYTAALLGNIRRSAEDFRPRAESGVRERLALGLGDVADRLLYQPRMAAGTQPVARGGAPEGMAHAKEGLQDTQKHELSQVLDYLFIVGSLAMLLTMVLLSIMCCYCFKYKAIRDQEREEIAAMLESRFSCKDGNRFYKGYLEDSDEELMVTGGK